MYAITVRPEDSMVTATRFLEQGEILLPEETEVEHGPYVLALRALASNHPVAYLDEQVVAVAPPSAYHVWHPVTFEYEVSAALLDQARAARWEEIKEYRSQRTAGGIPVGPYWFHSDTPSKLQHLGLLNARMLNVLPAGQQWKLMDGTFVTLTTTLVEQIFGAAMQRESANFTRAEQHRALMNASTDPANYDFTTGWLPIFGE